jgi:acetyl esterase/lipase
MKFVFALLATVLVAGPLAVAEAPSCATPGTDNAFLGIQTIKLWPGTPPEAKGDGCYDIPALTIFDPQPGTANGSAVIILPGGGYEHLAGNLEGRQFADWFAAHGFRAFILTYRLPSHGYLLPVPLIDARRAIQTVRARAQDYHIAPNRIVLIGFSAGGHLAALAATRPVPGDPNAEDAIDRVSSRPDYLVLGYPWIGAVSLDYAHLNYCKRFHLEDQCAALVKKYDPDLFVSKDTPPTFIYHTFDDRTVPIEQSLGFFQALAKAGVQTEYHVFASGSHGSGLGRGDLSLDQWPGLLETWLRGKGLLAKDETALNP